MGDYDSLLQLGLCYLLGYGTEKNYVVAQKSFEKILEVKELNICEETKENAQYWLGIISLLEFNHKRKSLKKARKFLELANHDHEQANELLNIIGKTKYIDISGSV